VHALTDRKVTTLRAQWLGHQLRELRERSGLTLRQVGEYLKRNFSALSRFENAEWPFPRGDVLQLLDLYGVMDKAERSRLIQLSEEVWRTDEWVDEYADAIYDRSFCDLPWLERRATRIRAFELARVPGLLQTREYAEALIRYLEGPEATDSQITRWVALRQERQQVIGGNRPTSFDAVIAEAVLRTPVGGASTMHDQLAHLLRLGRQRHIRLRVLPLSAGAHAGMDGAFELFDMPKPFPEVAHVETLAGRLYLEAPKSARFVRTYDRLREAALDGAASARLIEDVVEEMT
jgi:transcriptional regulator with XRE-family HTH domain